MEENQALDDTLNYKGDSTKITWMKDKQLVTFKFGLSYKNIPWGKRREGESYTDFMVKDKEQQ